MASKVRYEYHSIAGRVVQRKISRPIGTKRWHFELDCPSLVAVIEPSDESFVVHHGLAVTDELLVDAVRYYLGLLVDPKIPDIGPQVPMELAKQLSSHVADTIRRVNLQYWSFAEETDITGFLKGLLQKSGFKQGEWEAEIRAWTYSRRPKERDLGIDIGLLVDLLRRDLRVIKALWFQAKRTQSLPDDILQLPDLAAQIEKMQEYTSEAYALIYTPQEMYAFRGDAPREELAAEGIVSDSLLCRRGDRTPRVVALTGHSKLVVEMLVTAHE